MDGPLSCFTKTDLLEKRPGYVHAQLSYLSEGFLISSEDGHSLLQTEAVSTRVGLLSEATPIFVAGHGKTKGEKGPTI